MREFILIFFILSCVTLLFSSCDKEKPISGKVVGFRDSNYKEEYVYNGDNIVTVKMYTLQNEEWKYVSNYIFKYENDKIIRQHLTFSLQTTVTHAISLNDRRIEKIHHDDIDISYFYTYQDAYLSKATIIYADKPSMWYEEYFTYENENITRIQHYNMPTTVEPEGIRYEYDSTSVLNNANIDLFVLFVPYDAYYQTRYINNNFKRSKYLPSKINGEPIYYEIRDGYVTKISRMEKGELISTEIIYE